MTVFPLQPPQNALGSLPCTIRIEALMLTLSETGLPAFRTKLSLEMHFAPSLYSCYFFFLALPMVVSNLSLHKLH